LFIAAYWEIAEGTFAVTEWNPWLQFHIMFGFIFCLKEAQKGIVGLRADG